MKRVGDGDPDGVLDQTEQAGKDEKDEHLNSARPQQAETRPHADGSKEPDTQEGLKRGVGLQRERPVVQQKHQRGKDQPANHG